MTSSSGSNGNFGDAEAAALIVGETLLSRDDIPDENQQIDCFSCDEKMKGLFCHSCGQKNDDYRRSIWSLFSETFASVFSLENRMWRTWFMLLAKPGRIAREFSDGKRTAWTSPVRIYLAMSIILFGYMSVTETRIFSLRTDIVPKAGFVGDVKDLEDMSVKLAPDFGFFRRQAELDRLNAGTDFERVTRLMKGTPRQIFVFGKDLSPFGDLPSNDLLRSSGSWPDVDESDGDDDAPTNGRALALENYTDKVDEAVDAYNEILSVARDPATIASRLAESDNANTPLDIADAISLAGSRDLEQKTREAITSIDQELEVLGLTRSDIHNLPIENKNQYSINIGSGTIGRTELNETDIQKISIKFLRNPALLNEGISKYLPRIMFLMMPFAAIIGLIFIRGKQTALLYDHLVHATYIHAVTFAFLLLLILLSQWSPLNGMIYYFFLGIAVYLPLSAKKMFKRGWFKTIFASYSIAILYGCAMLVIVTILTSQSILKAADIGQV